MFQPSFDSLNQIKMTAERFLSDRGLVSSFGEINNYVILPGLCDVHVHFREPGFSYKETIKTGSLSAAAGGYTAVCTMPNLNPVPDSLDNLKIQSDIIKRDAVVNVIPYGSVTVGEMGGELSAMDSIADYVCAFSDDGRGVQSDEMMERAMRKAKELNKIIAAHCEVNSLLNGGYIHDGKYAKAHSHRGIPSESEFRQIDRDLNLAAKTGCKYHVCHISAKESVSLIRQAKKDGVDVTCETAPHYLTLCEDDLTEDARFKMNPPLRSGEDKEALIDALIDGTIDMISTDHAPHSKEEKSRGLEKSLMGVVGLETAFPVMYTNFVKNGIITIERLAGLMSYNARKRFSINSDTGFAVFNISDEFTVNPDGFYSMGRATPFEGEKLYGKHMLTVYNNNIILKGQL